MKKERKFWKYTIYLFSCREDELLIYVVFRCPNGNSRKEPAEERWGKTKSPVTRKHSNGTLA